MRERIVALVGAMVATCAVAAAGQFPERKVAEAKPYTIEYSVGDEAYAAALAKALPMNLNATGVAPQLPITVADLRSRRDEVLKLIAARLGLESPTPKMGQTYDTFAAGYTALQSLRLMDNATHFALWRKPELMARLQAGQDVAGFQRTPDGGIEFSATASFEFKDGESPEKSVARLREDWSRLTWPIKIGEAAGASADDEIRQRLADLTANAKELSAFQSAGIQTLAVMAVLHETVEATLVASVIRSPDRRWFCEGVANYVAFKVLESLTGTDVARHYYDADEEVKRYAAVRSKVDLVHWPVAEDPRAQEVPADLNAASYAFATQAVAGAFADGDLLARVLTEVRVTSLDKADIKTVQAAYQQLTGRQLSRYLSP